MNKIKELTIRQLLTYQLLVPEIQREYVWGDNPNSVLEQFLESLSAKLCKNINDKDNVGFLYSYQSNDYSKEHYLIDGQQRFTTLVLFLYYLSVKEGKYDEFKNIINIESSNLSFSYKVRATTDDFIKVLFRSKLITLQSIKSSKWMVKDFESDPTIKAIMHAFDIFNQKEWNLTFNQILDNVTFWYFDVSATSEGEELYITMNSRGEKLTDTEQLKPRLFSKLNGKDKHNYGKLWDNWEESFFRWKEKDMGIEVIDSAMSNIIRIYLELSTQRSHQQIDTVKDVDNINLGEVSKMMENLETLRENGFEDEVKRLFGQKTKDIPDPNFYILKALLVELHCHGVEQYNLERVYEVINNLIRRSMAKEQNAILRFLNKYIRSNENGCYISFYDYVLQTLTDDDTASMFIYEDSKKEIKHNQEIEKVRICNDNKDDHSVEEYIWKTQSKQFWQGDIRPLLALATIDGKFSFLEFTTEEKRFSLLFCTEKDGYPSDLLRRALLTVGLKNYPLDNWSFGKEHWTWMKILSKNNDSKLKKFIDGISPNASKQDAETYLNSLVNAFDSKNDWAEFVKEPEYLKYLDTKHLSWDDRYGFLLVKRSWAQPISVKNKYLDLMLTRNKDFSDLLSKSGWNKRIWVNWNSCVVIENEQLDISMDVRYLRGYEGGKKDQWCVDLFKRKVDATVVENELMDLAKSSGFSFDKESGRYRLYLPFDDNAIIKCVSNVIKTCSQPMFQISNR